MEQWAKNHNISPNRVSQIFLPVPLLLTQPIRKTTPTHQQKHPSQTTDLIQVVVPSSKHSNLKQSNVKNGIDNNQLENGNNKQQPNVLISNSNMRNGENLPRVSNETRTRRLIRSVFRVTRRFHVLRHLRQRGGSQSGSLGSSNKESSSRFTRMSFRRLTSRSRSRNLKISSPLQVNRGSSGFGEQPQETNIKPSLYNTSSQIEEQTQRVDTVDEGVVYATLLHENVSKEKRSSERKGQVGNDMKDPVTARRRPSRRRRHQYETDDNSGSDGSSRSYEIDKHKRRVVFLEQQVLLQQEEIQTLRDVVEDLRSSLQLSDAQNLALQVLLKKMSKAESSLLPTYASNGFSLVSSSTKNTPEDSPLSPTNPINSYANQYKIFSNGMTRKVPNGNVNSSNGDTTSNFKFRSQMDESEKQLENLVKELKEMSRTMYPPSNYLLMQNQYGLTNNNENGNNNNNNTNRSTTSSGSTFNGGGISYQDIDPLQEEITKTSNVLNGTKDELKATQQELKQTASRLHQKEFELEENSMNLKDAYKALEKAQKEILKMR